MPRPGAHPLPGVTVIPASGRPPSPPSGPGAPPPSDVAPPSGPAPPSTCAPPSTGAPCEPEDDPHDVARPVLTKRSRAEWSRIPEISHALDSGATGGLRTLGVVRVLKRTPMP